MSATVIEYFVVSQVEGSWFSRKPRPTLEGEEGVAKARQEGVALVLAKLQESRQTTVEEQPMPGITDLQAFLQVTSTPQAPILQFSQDFPRYATLLLARNDYGDCGGGSLTNCGSLLASLNANNPLLSSLGKRICHHLRSGLSVPHII